MGTELVESTTGQVVGISEEFMQEVADSGVLGYSEKMEDSLIPILGILQDNSAECKKKHAKYIEGAEPGMLIVRALGLLLRTEPPEQAPEFQPVGFDHLFVEWRGEPGDGVPVANYAPDKIPEDAREVPDPENPDRTTLRRYSNGNRVVETRMHYGHLILGDGTLLPLVISMAGTNHSASRQWTAMMKRFVLPGSGRKAPAFFRKYRLRTQFQQRGQQSWFKFAIVDLGWITDEQVLRQGLALAKSVAEGLVRPTDDAQEQSEDDDSIPI